MRKFNRLKKEKKNSKRQSLDLNSENNNSSSSSMSSHNGKNTLSSNNKDKNNEKKKEDSSFKMKGYFFLKKNKYNHKGYLKYLSISETNEDSKKKTKAIKDGFGIITWDDNYKLYGIFTNNELNGYAKFTNPLKTTVYMGEYEKNKPKGYGYYENTNGYSIEGSNWIKNNINDLGIEIWKDGSFYKGEYKNNKKEGIGYFKWKDGTIYEGEFYDDQMNGFGIITYKNNNKFAGQFKNGLINGYGEFSWGNNKKYIGNYVNEIKEGFGIYVWDILIFEAYLGFWKNGKMNGLGVKIKGDVVKYGSWKDGKKEFWINDSNELIKIYKKGSMNKKGHEISNYYTKVMRRSYTSSDFDHNIHYLNLMVKDIEFIKKFIIVNYFSEEKIYKFLPFGMNDKCK